MKLFFISLCAALCMMSCKPIVLSEKTVTGVFAMRYTNPAVFKEIGSRDYYVLVGRHLVKYEIQNIWNTNSPLGHAIKEIKAMPIGCGTAAAGEKPHVECSADSLREDNVPATVQDIKWMIARKYPNSDLYQINKYMQTFYVVFPGELSASVLTGEAEKWPYETILTENKLTLLCSNADSFIDQDGVVHLNCEHGTLKDQ